MQDRGNSTDLEFVPLHFGNKLRVVNPRGRIGIITLWSKIEFVEKKLVECGADLNPETSRVAVIGNLYGNGLPHLLRNLLYNPQIRDLVICGADRSGSAGELMAFFQNGLEETMSLGETVTRIRGTSRIIDALVTPDHFVEKPRIVQFGDLSGKASVDEVCRHLQGLSTSELGIADRVEIELPEVRIGRYPSEPRNHNIVRDTPLEAWRELVFRLVRFGHLTHLRKGDRQELQNVRVVVRKPKQDDPAELAKFSFTLDELLHYQKDMLAAELPEDQPYTYGNRIRRYYGFDALEKFAARLRENPQDRDCYLALWDSRHDIDAEDGPCLVSMFFRVFDEKLTLTATYRTHNALDAWLKNVYGLMNAQEIVAEKAGIEVGSLTVISHSISVDPSKYDLAQRVSNAKGFEFDLDPNGQFLFAVDQDAGEIVVQHVSEDGVTLHEYRSDRPQRIQHELARDLAISDVGHAIYVGRQLTRAEMCLKTGEEFVEE